MIVPNLISALEKLPAHMECLIDITKDGEKLFHFKEIHAVEAVEDSAGYAFIAIAGDLGIAELGNDN